VNGHDNYCRTVLADTIHEISFQIEVVNFGKELRNSNRMGNALRQLIISAIDRCNAWGVEINHIVHDSGVEFAPDEVSLFRFKILFWSFSSLIFSGASSSALPKVVVRSAAKNNDSGRQR
jgi:hypothetical protein